MSSSDCILWIGGPYTTIPKFLKEAQRRGCCRKLPYWPAWLEPGRSRVFLAHQGGLSGENGVIFGYFLPAGQDIVMDDRQHAEGRRPAKEPQSDPIDALVDALLDCHGDRAPGVLRIPRFRTRLEAKRDCGFRPFEEKKEEEEKPPPYSAVYLVDQLTRDVDIFFCELVKELIQQELKREGKPSTPGTPHGITQKEWDRLKGRVEKRVKEEGIFEQAVQKAQEVDRSAPEIPASLRGHAEPQGTLVLFNDPYPVFHRIPRAAFRGLIQIDGERLLAEIASAYAREPQGRPGKWKAREVSLPYVPQDKEKPTQADLVSELARRCQINKTLASDFLKAFEELVALELKNKRRVSLARFGAFSVRDRSARHGTNPITRMPMEIPAGTTIRFQPSEALKRLI